MLGLVALALGAGIAAAGGAAPAVGGWLLGNPWGLLALPLLGAWRHRRRAFRAGLVLLLVGPAAWYAAWRAPQAGPDEVAGLAPRRFIRVLGTVVTPPERTVKGWRAEVVCRRPRTGRLVVQWPAEASLGVGHQATWIGRLSRPEGPSNPGEFDYRTYLARRGVFARLTAEGARDLGPAPGAEAAFARSLAALRARVLAGLGAGLPSRDAALLGSLVLGAGAAPVDEETSQAYRQVGLAHLLAASGAQVALIAALFLGLARRAGASPRAAALACAPLLLVYLALTGAPPSMARATGMGLVALGGLALGRRGVPYASLYATAIALMLLQPSVVFDAGAQFSFLATYGLIRFGEGLRWWERTVPAWLGGRGRPGRGRPETGRPETGRSLGAGRFAGPQTGRPETGRSLGAGRFAGPLLGFAGVPVAAALWVTPWQVACFQTWSDWSLVANWLAAPLIMGLTPWGLAVAAVGMASPGAAALLNGLTGLALALLQALVGGLAALPGVTRSVPAPGPWCLLAIYGALWAGLRHPRWAIAGVLLALLWRPVPPPASELRLSFLSIGQGDACVVRTPSGRFVVVDAGPADDGYDAGARTVLPYLRREGCGRVDLMIASHAHQDHVGGLGAVARALPVGAAWDAGQEERGPGMQAMLGAWLAGGTPWAIARAGRVWRDGPVSLEVWAPFGDEPTTNGGSVVCLLRYGRFSALLTGDMEAEGEKRLLERHRLAGLGRLDVLKVAHHGSRSASSPAWIAGLSPRLAVISCGLHNRFRHPHRETLRTLARERVETLRTDRDGAVLVRSDGARWAYSTGAEGWRRWRVPRAGAPNQLGAKRSANVRGESG